MVGSISGRIAANSIRSTSSIDETPLLSKQDGGATVATSVNSDERESVVNGTTDNKVATEKPTAGQLFKSVLALLVTAAGAAAWITAFIFHPAVAVYVAGSVCLMNFPIVVYKERKILFLPSHRKSVDRLQEMVDLLKAEADYLEDEIEYLLGQVAR